MSCHHRQSALSILDALQRERRPRLLLQAARAGLASYRRDSDLRRVLRLPAAPRPGAQTVAALLELEQSIEARRRRRLDTAGEPWRPARHVEVMIALMAESRLMVEAVPQASAFPLTLVTTGERQQGLLA